MEIIKKYKNRKLYSTTESKYVSLCDIKDRLLSDSKFIILSGTGMNEDVTDDVIKKCFDAFNPMSVSEMIQFLRLGIVGEVPKSLELNNLMCDLPNVKKLKRD